MRRFGLEPWKSVWTETLQRDLNVSEERRALDRFFGPDLLASTALLSCVYHERPVLGQLLHSRLPQYATARHVFLSNKSLTDVMHAQYFDWFKKGRTPDAKGHWSIGNELGFQLEFEKAAQLHDNKLKGEETPAMSSVERQFGAFANVQGISTNRATMRLVGLSKPEDLRRRPEWLTAKQFRNVKDPKMRDWITLQWTEADWNKHCLEKYGYTRPFDTRPNIDSESGMPGHGKIYASDMCKTFENDPRAGVTLYSGGNVAGGDLGQHRPLQLAPRAGDHVGSLHDTAKVYAHKTKRCIHIRLGKMAAGMRMPDDVERQAANDRLTERLRQWSEEDKEVPDEAFFAAAMPADFSFTIELEKATREEVVKYALAWVRRLRAYYDALGRPENIMIILGKEFTAVGRGQAVANRKLIVDILSDHFLVVLYNENYSSQLHYACGRPMEQYRKHEVRTKICYCCTAERPDGRHVLVNRDFNAAVNMVDWFCYELQYGQRPLAACGPNRTIAPIQGADVSRV
jgi:hypothetical protein